MILIVIIIIIIIIIITVIILSITVPIVTQQSDLWSKNIVRSNKSHLTTIFW